MKTLSLVMQKYFGLMLLSVLLGIVLFLAAPGSMRSVQAKPLLATRTFTIKNNCGYTIYPGIYPASTYSNGGWSMAAGAQVSFTVPDGNIGRLWGRTGCNGASPAVCTTGSCGGSGLQCAGTTGFPNTSLFEWNINAGGTDWYDVSYVDAVDNPIGVQVSNSGCVSPNSCSNSVLTNCPADLRSGSVCLSPCTKYNTDQYCCRGAYGTAATCVVANWAASAQTYVNNVHTYCPREYAYAYDENSGGALQTCATGASYTITFCPAGGSGGGPTPTPAPTSTRGGISTTTWYSVINRNSAKCVDARAAGTAHGTAIQPHTCNNTKAPQYQFQATSSGYYRVNNRNNSAQVWDVSGVSTADNALIHLWSYVCGNNQQWLPVSEGGGYYHFVARHSGKCLDVPAASTADSVQLVQYTCNGTGAQSFSLQAH